jgi:hypothetical protein
VADLGYRDNVMGPQPIGQRKPIPEDLISTVERILDFLAEGKGAEVAAMATENAKDESARLASATKAGSYSDKKVLAVARINAHYWVKAKMTGPAVKPFVIQLRMGPDKGRWIIWEAANLTDSKSGWTK